MAERRDNKNRILKNNEYQKSDGRYMFKYKDINDVDRFVYSWTLTQTDKTPSGKKPGKCLREIERDIALDKANNINTYSSKATLNELFDEFLRVKKNLRNTTKNTYYKRYNQLFRNAIGKKRITDIKYNALYELYSDLLISGKFKTPTLVGLAGVISSVYDMAIRNNIVNRNISMEAVKQVVEEYGQKSPKKEALTERQQELFMEYIKEHDDLYGIYSLCVFLLGTGCRIGETLGLTWDECDFKKDVIHIRNNLVYVRDLITMKTEKHINPPKTAAGIRDIPMLQIVKSELLKERMRQIQNGFSIEEIDGVKGFVFISRNRTTKLSATINRSLKEAVKSYNKQETALANSEDREPELLPYFSVHTLRHTFCSRFCALEKNFKIAQEIMGHSDIKTTMNIYNSVSMEQKEESFKKLDSLFFVG